MNKETERKTQFAQPLNEKKKIANMIANTVMIVDK